MPRVSQVGDWASIDDEAVTGEEFVSLQVEFEAAVKAYQAKYRFGIRLISAYRVNNATLRDGFEDRRGILRNKGKSDAVSRLYHGTSEKAAKIIVQRGFMLPRRAGMFGKGIYFADTPLKSLQYTQQDGRGVMLVCDVALGNSMVKHSADNTLETESQKFKRGFIPRLLGQKSFDSVTAGKLAVRVPEYVVYNSTQAVPRYVLMVEKTKAHGYHGPRV